MKRISYVLLTPMPQRLHNLTLLFHFFIFFFRIFFSSPILLAFFVSSIIIMDSRPDTTFTTTSTSTSSLTSSDHEDDDGGSEDTNTVNDDNDETTEPERTSPKSVADFLCQEGKDVKQSKGEVTTENAPEEEVGLEEFPNTSSSRSNSVLERRMRRKNNLSSSSSSLRSSSSSLRQMSRRMSKRLSKQFVEPIKPETPLGWTALCSTAASLLTIHELRLQKKLTCPPLVYAQNTPFMNVLREKLGGGGGRGNKSDISCTNTNRSGILTRNIQPSLFVGTRSTIASAAAYALHHRTTPAAEKEYIRFREIMRMDTDGATIAIDWELPRQSQLESPLSSDVPIHTGTTKAERIAHVKYGPIDRPVVIILHGINNDTSFGYMRSLMRACTNRGWIACGFNFRGCGKIPMTTPRGYNAGYTGDLRNVIHKIRSRLADADDTPVFLVGNSLGANVMTKYLGEEGFSGTLPKCVKGGVSLGNPLHIHSGNLTFPWNLLLGMGVKKTFIQNWKSIHDMSNCIHFKRAVKRAMLSKTIGQLDHEMSPFLIRNESQYPFVTRLGYVDGENYWHDSSSNQYIQHASVPLLILSSQDDFLVADSALRSLAKCLSNPNVLVVKTKCGGHLGWQEAPPSGMFGIGTSWADTAMADFFSSVLETGDISKFYITDTSVTTEENDVSTPSKGSIVDCFSFADVEGRHKHMRSKL